MHQIDFDKPIAENRKANRLPFLVAHRGVCGANIPCNSTAAFLAALDCGADVIELDVSVSCDKQYFVFHPGMEHVYLQGGKPIAESTADEVLATPLLNADRAPTHYRVPTLSEIFALLKGKVYINVDKFWTDIEGITQEIYRAGVEKQVIVKTYADKPSLEKIKAVAPELMFMQMVRNTDTTTDWLLDSGVKFIGNELLFDREDAEIMRPAYLQKLKDSGLLAWGNSIVYDERDVISAGHTDDSAYNIGKAHGWGWFADRGFDFIQTNWLLACRKYLQERQAGKA